MVKMPTTIRIAATQATGGMFQPSMPNTRPIHTQQKKGPQKENMPLQAMPRAAPHMALPLYHSMKPQ